MIGNHYQAHKKNVIDLFERYKEKRGNINDGVDINFLTSRIDSLKNGKFTLAVAGEVKAGKSTFINALLGAEILPADVLQASSAIVEIFKSEKSFLKVKYADEQEENIHENLSTSGINAKDRLHDICRISEEYRGIPTTLIDEYIVDSTTTLEVSQDVVSLLEKQSGENLEGKTKLLEKYINNRSKNQIPVKIEFGYPLNLDLDELRIVDSPGVNAIGGVQDVSFKFFEEANAILFVHPIKPIESESFRKFVNSVISNRSKETLFLVLTHAGLHSDSDIDKLHSEAVRLYKTDISEKRILIVDSLLQLIYCDLENGKSVKEIRKIENKKKILASCREKAEDEERELIDVVSENSRFEKMFCAIDEFSMKAPNIQLQEILESIKEGYCEQESQYESKIKRLEDKKRNPQEFESEIHRINTAYNKYKLLMHRTKEDMISKYSGRHSDWQKNIEDLKAKFFKVIIGSDSPEIARKHTVDAMNEIHDKINVFSSELTETLRKRLEETGHSFREEYQISLPKVDLKSLEEKAKKKAYKTEPVYTTVYERKWYTLWYRVHAIRRITGKKDVFDQKMYLDKFKIVCKEEFYNIVNTLKIKDILNTYLELFSREMNFVIEERIKALKDEKDKQQTNNEIIDEIEQLGRKKMAIQPEAERLIEILVDIK